MDVDLLTKSINKLNKQDIIGIFKSYVSDFIAEEMHDMQIDLFGVGLPIIQIGWEHDKNDGDDKVNDKLIMTVGSASLYKIVFKTIKIDSMINLFEKKKEEIKQKVIEYAPRIIANENLAKELMKDHIIELQKFDCIKTGRLTITKISTNWLCGYMTMDYKFEYHSYKRERSMNIYIDETNEDFVKAYPKNFQVEEDIAYLEPEIINFCVRRYGEVTNFYRKPVPCSFRFSVNEKYALINYIYKTADMGLAKLLKPFDKSVPFGAREKYNSLMLLLKLYEANNS